MKLKKNKPFLWIPANSIACWKYTGYDAIKIECSDFSQHITVQTNTSKTILRNLCKITLKLRIDVPIKVLF